MPDFLPEEPFTFEPPNIWLTSFWDPQSDLCGFLGFTYEWDRKFFIENSYPGCLVVAYITRNSPRVGPELRGKIAVILQATHDKGLAKDFMSKEAYVKHERDPDTRGKWHFAVRVDRAWRVLEGHEPNIDEIAPRTYRGTHRLTIARRGTPFDPIEARELQHISVLETPIPAVTQF